MDNPHWEHGYRCHGFWLGLTRVGFVGLPPRGTGGAKEGGYGWFLEVPPKQQGRTKTLRAAKKAVEKTYQERIKS